MGFIDTTGRIRRQVIADIGAIPEDFRLTFAKGVADFAVGATFCTNQTGEMRRYERIAAAPGYRDLGDSAAPLSRADAPRPRVVAAAVLAVDNDRIAADTTVASFAISLPAAGGTVTITDAMGTWGTHALTINGNGRTIDGQASFLADASGFSLTFTAVGTTWRYAINYQHGA